ncbi:MAG TPA: alkaline phosphatase family protein [Thermoanaerobaculia bacterium]
MRKYLLLIVLAFGCAPATPPAAVPQAPPPLAANGAAVRVVLMSFDGFGADAYAARAANLPALGRMVAEGASARVIPVNPTVTSSAHVSILTGADPQHTGIVGNRFHVPGTPRDAMGSGYETDPDVESLLEAARRQGKRVGAIAFPTLEGKTPRRTADFGMPWTNSLTDGRIVHLTRTDFHREWVPPTWTDRPHQRRSFSPILRARIEWAVPRRVRTDVDIVAYDTTDDARENYDAIYIESEERESAPDARGWFAVSVAAADGLYGSWSKLLHADPSLADMTIYWGPISRTEAYPASFRALLDGEVGFWPGSPEEHAGIDTTTFIEQSDRLADFLTRAQTLALERMQCDLLLAYQPQVDGAMHNFLGTAEETRVVDAAFAAADRAVAAIQTALDLTRDAFVVAGDHGLMPANTEVRMNRWLEEHGFAPRWQAFASSNVAHLYRFEGEDDGAALVTALQGTGWFERVERKSAAMHPNSGDVVAIAVPHVILNSSNNAPATIAITRGTHGGLNTHPELHTRLFALGAGVRRGAYADLPQTRVARYVATLLGITPPAAAE